MENTILIKEEGIRSPGGSDLVQQAFFRYAPHNGETLSSQVQKMFRGILAISAIVMLLTGCGIGPLTSGIDSMRTPDGEVILLDTVNNWQTWTLIMDLDMEAEAEGEPPPGGAATWSERWARSIHALQDGHQENWKRYAA